MYTLSTEYWFDSAHFLTDYNGKCENLHGHQWRVAAYVRADKLCTSGTEKDMVVDFATLKRIVREECDALDHTFLVEEGSLAPATLEALKSEGFSLTMLPFRHTFAPEVVFARRLLQIRTPNVYRAATRSPRHTFALECVTEASRQ